MRRNRSLIKNILNTLLIISTLVVLQLACNWKNFSVSQNNQKTEGTQTNTSQSTEPPKSETPDNCKVSYYPVSENVERKYSIKYTDNVIPPQEYSETYSDFKDNTFVGKMTFKDVTSTITWRCVPEGLVATQYNNFIDMKTAGNSKIETLKSEGISFPADSKWKLGETWFTKYQVAQQINAPNGQKSGESSGNINQDMEVIGEEEITTPAGKFQTFKVRNKTLLDMTIKVQGVTAPAKVNVETLAWFAKDVGMVKSQVNFEGKSTAVTELLSYKK